MPDLQQTDLLEQWSLDVGGPKWGGLPCSEQLQRLAFIMGAFMLAACESTLGAQTSWQGEDVGRAFTASGERCCGIHLMCAL